MSRPLVFTIVLAAALILGGCFGGPVTVDLPGGRASLSFPEQPKTKKSVAPVRFYLGDQSSADQAPSDPNNWRQTEFTVTIYTYLVETDPQYPWGSYVFEFTDKAVETEGAQLLEFARSHLIVPGAYLVKDEKITEVGGLKTLEVTAEQGAGSGSRLQARMIQRDNMIYMAFFEGQLDDYGAQAAMAHLEGLKVMGPVPPSPAN